ncbi:ParB N-terminal domain-containing protein (plasmid) [Sulfitobacter faviae]|uniref:ParB/RepB/Spo0J family partition protein n=1 Tax=Sulfitobacter faviae TaxID=1775881 RepID=UPI002306F7A7|nr:ParB N-terminal domain-containing protein [Sulfitobacter faviae]WCE68607.1 ParB N-terminal domain-containing protein [Sulfitobacter faviae]
MASAIAETAEATHARADAKAAIRAENDALAHEHVRLKKLGLITDQIQTSEVLTSKLTRDGSANVVPGLDELKDSIKADGLLNPIRVEKTENGFDLIQGYRRLSAFRQLAEETGDPRYSRIPAAMVPRGEPLVGLYRKMVDENLIRKDLSFGEMTHLALSYAGDEGIGAAEAVSSLYASALKQKRTYIRQFARVLEALEGAVRYPEAIPRALGLDLYKLIEGRPDLAKDIADHLNRHPERDKDAEWNAPGGADCAKKRQAQRGANRYPKPP